MTITTTTPDSTDNNQANLKTLLFDVDSLDQAEISTSGILQKKAPATYWNFSFITDLFYSDDQPEQIKLAVEQMLDNINHDRDKYSDFSDNEIKAVIIDKLIPAKAEYFSPRCLANMKNIQRILVPKIGELRDLKRAKFDETFEDKNIDEVDSKAPTYIDKKSDEYINFKTKFLEENPDYKMDMGIAKAKLMFLLKVGIELNKGSTGSIVVSWFKKKNIGVFKPENSEQTWNQFFVNILKFQMGMQISHLKTAKMARPRAEVAAHIMSQHYNLKITCPTTITTIEKTEGSFQLFAQGTCEAKDIKEDLESRVRFYDKEILNFQLMVILDYLMGDLDGHEENWLVKKGTNGCLIEELFKIDNANTFIHRNPSPAVLTDLKQYVWSTWRIAGVEFCDKAKELMLKMTKDDINIIVEKIRDKIGGFLSNDMIRLLHQRAQVLSTLATIEKATPNCLGSLKTDEEIEGFLKKYRKFENDSTSQFIEKEFTIIQNYSSANTVESKKVDTLAPITPVRKDRFEDDELVFKLDSSDSEDDITFTNEEAYQKEEDNI